MDTFSFNHPKNLSGEAKWSLAVISFEATNSVPEMNDGKKKFSNTTPGHRSSRGGEDTFNKLPKTLEFDKH